jgi:hypothetical protein
MMMMMMMLMFLLLLLLLFSEIFLSYGISLRMIVWRWLVAMMVQVNSRHVGATDRLKLKQGTSSILTVR